MHALPRAWPRVRKSIVVLRIQHAIDVEKEDGVAVHTVSPVISVDVLDTLRNSCRIIITLVTKPPVSADKVASCSATASGHLLSDATVRPWPWPWRRHPER